MCTGEQVGNERARGRRDSKRSMTRGQTMQQAAKRSHKWPSDLTSGQMIQQVAQMISQQAAKRSHNKWPNEPTSGPNDLTTSGQTISQQAAKRYNKRPNDTTSGQTIQQAATEQEDGQGRTVIGETCTNSATCAAEKKRVGKSCESSASFVENPR